MFGEPLWRKLERETRMKASFPELNGTSPDEVMAVDADRTRRGAGTVTDFSQRVMQLARYAAEEARRREEERNRTGAMPEGIDQGSRGQRPYSVSAPEKRPGVPRGVAEAFPETVQGGPVYDSGSSAPSINLTGSLLDNQEGLPGPVKSALNTPVLGQALREGARPANWMSAAIAPLSFAPGAGAATRFGAEIAAGTAGALAGQKVTDLTGNSLAGFGASLLTGTVAGAGVSRAGGLLRSGGAASSMPASPIRKIGSVGFHESKALDPALPVDEFARVSDVVLGALSDTEERALLDYVGLKEGVDKLRASPDMIAALSSKAGPLREWLRGFSSDGRTIRAYRFESGEIDTGGLESWALSPKAPRIFSNLYSQGKSPITIADIDIDAVVGPGAADDFELLVRTDNATSAFKNIPEPGRPEMPAVRVPSGGSALSEVLDSVIPGENVGTALLRRYEGRLNTEGLVIKRELDSGNEYLKATGVGKSLPNGRLNVGRTPEMEQLFKALHGEGEPPLALKPVFDDLKAKVAEETGRSVDFDQNFMARPDYFPRGWKAPKETRLGAGRMGATPGFKKARNDLTFSEMLDEGWEPASWNPYEMLALRRVAGAEFREQTDLVRFLQDSGQAVVADGPLPDGYRVPRVGPAFEGKPKIIPSAEEGQLPGFAGYTKRWAVPDHIADVVENIYGSKMSLGKVGPVDVLETIRGAGQLSKRSKLLGSLFQQVDFSTRTGFAQFGGAVDSLTRGHPIEAIQKTFALPAEIGKLAYANVSGARRAALRDQVLSDAPIFKDRPGVTLKGISQAGWSQTDITILPRDIRSVIDFDTPKNLPTQVLSAATGKIRKLDKAMNDGLFDGVYPQAQITALKNFIVPAISRQHPDWTDEQIMGSAAVEVNKMFSTLGNFQTIFANRGMRELSRNLIFSTNEPEALIKGSLSTVKGPNKRLWAENYIGGALFLAGVANAIHLAATGEPLPLDRYSPVTMDKGDGPLGLNFNPVPFDYNARFMSPNIPGVEGRNGTQVAIDLMGQMDTIFRVLDPNAFLTARFSAPLRAGLNQYAGKDFFGRPLETPKERIAQAVSDLLSPIGATNLMGALGVGPENEGRLGQEGQLIQASGLNLRAENNQQLRDRMASEYAQQQGLEGVTSLDELATAMNLTRSNTERRLREAFPDMDAELTQRRDESAEADSATAQRIELDNFRAQARTEQEADDARVQSGEISWDQWKDNRTRRMEQVRGFSTAVYGDQAIEKPKNAYEEWLNVVRENRTPDGVDWDAVDGWIAQQPETAQKFIEDNTGLYGTKLEKERRAVADELDRTGYFDVSDKTWATVQKQTAFAKTVAGFDDYYGWYQAQISKLAGQMVKSGLPPGAANVEAERALRTHPIVQAYGELKNALESQWVAKVIKTDLPDHAMRMGYFKPTKEQSEMILTYPGARTAVMP